MFFIPVHCLPDPEAAVPSDFYDVRAETTPKAGPVPLYSFTALIYVAALVSFITLYQLEAAKSTTETVIVPFDNSGNSGYTCQMISRVTATYQAPSVDDPELAYNLVNVMELKSDCESDLAIADPCSEPMTFFPGTVSELWPSGTMFGAAAMYKDTNVFVYDTTLRTSLTNYNYSSGQYHKNVATLQDTPITTSLAIDRNGEPIYLAMSSVDNTVVVYRAPLQTSDYVLAYNTGAPYATIFNDNLYNIYYATNTTFVYLDVYNTGVSGPVDATVLFTVADGDIILYAAVYHDGASPTVYYYTADSALTHSYYQFKGGVTTLYSNVLNTQASVQGMAADATYVYFSQHYSLDRYYVVRQVPGQIFQLNNVISYVDSTIPAPAFAIDPSGEGKRLFLIQKNPSNVENWAFLYPGQQEIYVDGVYTVPAPEYVASRTAFGAEWFACGNQLWNSTNYDPGEVLEYPQSCPNNGLVGKVLYGENTYAFTASDAAVLAVDAGAAACPALVAPICNTVSALPPYSCSRTLHQGFFICAATAVANAQFLVQVLIFVFAVLLPRLAVAYPVRMSMNGHIAHHRASHADVAVAPDKHAVGKAQAADTSPLHATAPTADGVPAGRTNNSTADAYLEMAVMERGLFDVESGQSTS